LNISSGCTGTNETKVECDSTNQSGYTCTYNSTSGRYKITGLSNSGIKQIDYTQPVTATTTIISISSSGGAGGGGCLTYWKCTDWSQCVYGKQQRVCSKESSNCYASEISKPSETQDCNGNVNPYQQQNTNPSEIPSAGTNNPNSQNQIPNTLFDINIKPVKDVILKTEKFSAVVKLMNLGVPGQVNANVNYIIRDSQNKIIYQEIQIVLVETQTEFIKEFPLYDMTIGTYSITADLTYNGQKEPAQSTDNFEVADKISQTNSITGFSIAVQQNSSTILVVLMAILAMIIIIGLYKSRSRLRAKEMHDKEKRYPKIK
jgi:hypothetical protein